MRHRSCWHGIAENRKAMCIALLLLLLIATPAIGQQPSGLLFFATYRNRDNAAAATNPHIVGGLHTIYWSEVEQKDGVCDWADLDRRIKPWLAARKKIALRIMWSSSGAWVDPSAKQPMPQWVLAKGAAIAVSPRTNTQVPLFWDPVYKMYSQRFLREVARRFDGNPQLVFIDATPGAETNPYRFGMDLRDPEFREIFKKAPASDGKNVLGCPLAGDRKGVYGCGVPNLPEDEVAGDPERGQRQCP